MLERLMNAMIASSKNLRISAARFSSAHSKPDKPFLNSSILIDGDAGDVYSTFFRVGGGGEVLLTGLTRDDEGVDGDGEGEGEEVAVLFWSFWFDIHFHLVNQIREV